MVSRIQAGASRTELVKAEILNMIRGQNPRLKKLPSEGELSRTLGVSISTIREALRLLNKEGFITKKHGSGNYIHWSALDCPMRIDLIFDFRKLMEDSGNPVQEISEAMKELKSGEFEKDTLGLPLNSEILEYSRTYKSSVGTGIYSISSLSRAELKGQPEDRASFATLGDFIWKNCGKEVAHSLCTFIPEMTDEKLKTIFEFKDKKAVIKWVEVFYDIEDNPVLSTKVYFNPDLILMSLLRKQN